MTMKWKLDERLPDGGRLFVNDHGFAVADNSGRTPDLTHDGILWLDRTRPLEIGPSSYCAIPVKQDTTGGQYMVPSNPATLLLLSARFEWSIRVSGSGAEYVVSG